MKIGPSSFYVPDWDEHSFVIAEHAKRYYGFKDRIKHQYPEKLNGIAIDIGAHVGYWSVLMSLHFQKVYAFEPLADNYECLVANKKRYDTKDKIYAWQIALGDDHHPFEMKKNPHSKISGNSGAWHVAYSKDSPTKTMPLDTLFWCQNSVRENDSIGLIKIDVEGLEAAVLRGAANVIKEHKPAIILEQTNTASLNYSADDNEPIEIIKDMGYRDIAKEGRDHLYIAA